jgi:hypothetical protein
MQEYVKQDTSEPAAATSTTQQLTADLMPAGEEPQPSSNSLK